MKRAFVSGGTGFLGLNLIEQLQATGEWQISAMHRATSNLKYIKKFDVELVEAGLDDPDALRAAMPDNVDAVFHVAANINLWKRGNAQQTRDNVEGTRNIAKVALEKGVGRFIHTSSVARYGIHDGRIDETAEPRALDSDINYNVTKYLAEEEVRECIQAGLDAVFVNPAHIMGRYDAGSWGRIFKLIITDALPGIPPGGGSFAHSVEVAKAHIAAFHKGKTGENYLLGGTDASFFEVFTQIGKLVNKKTPSKPLPSWVLKFIAYPSYWMSLITNKEPDVTPEKATLVSHAGTVDSSKAIRELDYRAVPIELILKDCHDWMKLEGLV